MSSLQRLIGRTHEWQGVDEGSSVLDVPKGVRWLDRVG